MEKAGRLEKEAFDDLKRGNANKCASALYFSLHRLSCELLTLLNERIPRRDDKLANAIENKGLLTAAMALRHLYALRKKADYSPESVTLPEIEETLELYRSAKEELLKKIKEVLKRKGIKS